MKEENYQYILRHYWEPQMKNMTADFLRKYWLNGDELQSLWLPIKDSIFKKGSKRLPDMMFEDNYELIAQKGGVLFTKNEFLFLQKCMRVFGEQTFVLIENSFVRERNETSLPYLHFKFPVDITWEALNNGNENMPDISFDVLWMMDKEFFVFGDSGVWGKYVGIEYNDTPIDVIGFKPELSSHFIQLKKKLDEIWEWLPPIYKERMLNR